MVVKIEEDFLTLQRELVSQLPRIEANIADLDERIPEISYQFRKANERVESLEDERSYLLESNTNVPPDLSRLRKSLAKYLDRMSRKFHSLLKLFKLYQMKVNGLERWRTTFCC